MKIGQTMKKNFVLPFYLLCACSLSACNSTNTSYQAPLIPEEDTQVIDATVNPQNRCGVNGISCNDTPLINYTKTEADYRTYGERTKRDHLYTQSAVGNNLTATIQPDVEADIVSPQKPEMKPIIKKDNIKYTVDDGVFSQTGSLDLEPSRSDYILAEQDSIDTPEEAILSSQHVDTVISSENPESDVKREVKKEVKRKIASNNKTEPKNEIGRTSNIEVIGMKKIKKSVAEDGSTYEIVCEEECDDIIDEDIITSEFTEDSFDIADYVDDENIEFTNVGKPNEIITDVDIAEIQVGDDTILTWEAEEGENLRELLTKWSAMSGWKLLWNTNRNYILSAGVMFKGKFADVSSALRAFARARPAPIATYYKGNRVIVVETMENENAY